MGTNPENRNGTSFTDDNLSNYISTFSMAINANHRLTPFIYPCRRLLLGPPDYIMGHPADQSDLENFPVQKSLVVLQDQFHEKPGQLGHC